MFHSYVPTMHGKLWTMLVMPNMRRYMKIYCAISIVSSCFLRNSSVELQASSWETFFPNHFDPFLSSWTCEADGPGAFSANARGERIPRHFSAVPDGSVA